MKKHIRLPAILLAVLLLVQTLALGASAASDTPGYRVEGVLNESAGTLTANIYLCNANAASGSFALRFDPEKLQLAGGGSFGDVVKPGDESRVTPQGLTDEVSVSQNEGYVLIGWYPSGTRINALDADKLICSVEFRLLAGAEGLDAFSLGMFDLRAGAFQNWDSGASIFSDISAQGGPVLAEIRRYNIADSAPLFVELDYPNCDVIPADAGSVTFQVHDLLGGAPDAELIVNGTIYETGGRDVVVPLVDGIYSYYVSAAGLETYVGRAVVRGGGTVQVSLRSDTQIAQLTADKLEIGYAKGDSAEHVSAPIGLPRSGPNRTYVSWQSDKPGAIDLDGNIFPTDEKQTVTLTATVTKGSAAAVREFVLTLLPKSQQNQSPVYWGDGETGDKNEDGQPDTGFSDLAGYDWAEEAIVLLSQAGIINGTGNGTFSPGANISRADFTCLIMRMLVPEGELAQEGFPDVVASSYYYDEVMRAKALGIAQGGAEGFRPGDSITRQDMIVLCYRAMQKLGHAGETADLSTLESHTDGAAVSDYARAAMACALSEGWIVGGTGGALNPLQNTTRAEAAVFLYRIYQQVIV